MPNGKDPERQLTGRIGGLTGWHQTPDRSERMDRVRRNSPADDGYHASDSGSAVTPAPPRQFPLQARTPDRLH